MAARQHRRPAALPKYLRRTGQPARVVRCRGLSAGAVGLRSSTARRSKPLRKCNATARAAWGNLGGFCVSGARMVTQRTTTPKELED